MPSKTITDERGNTSPNPAYLDFLEARVIELEAQISSLRNQNAALKERVEKLTQAQNRRARVEADSLPHFERDY